MTFAAAIARANLAVFRHLSDCQAVLDNVGVEGAFRNGYVAALGGVVGATDPTYTLPTADAKRTAQGSTLRIVDGPHAGLRFTVQTVEPDGTGVSTLRLLRVTSA